MAVHLIGALALAASSLVAARGVTPAAFGRRCIPAPTPTRFKTRVGGPGADCVVLLRQTITDDTLGRRAKRRGPRGADFAPWGGSAGRLAALGATLEFHHGPLARAYQGRNRGPEQSDRFSRRIRIGRDGRFSISNVSGDITITGGGGDEVSIEAVKHARGSRVDLDRVHIEVAERPGRVEVRTESDRGWDDRNGSVSVDYTISLPASAGVDAKSVSGVIRISNVQGIVRVENVSGDVLTSATPKVELVKSVSGDVSLGGVTSDGDLSASSVSGSVTAKGVKARGLDLATVSGTITISDASCDRLDSKSVSGDIGYSGTIARAGRYNINTHSGSIRLTLSGSTGFELIANTFSGNIRSDLPITIGGSQSGRPERPRFGPGRSLRGTFGDGSASLSLRTFSGDVVIQKR